MWDITTVDYLKMQYICETLEKIKDILMQMEGSGYKGLVSYG